MTTIDNISNKNTVLNNPNTDNTSKIKKSVSFIDVFKNYFNKNINKESVNCHDVTIADVKNTARAAYESLIKSGAKVVNYDRRTGMTEFDNGISIYYKVESDKAYYSMVQEFEDGSMISGTIKTDESNQGFGCEKDSNDITVMWNNGKDGDEECGEYLNYNSVIKKNNTCGSFIQEIIDEQYAQNGTWKIFTKSTEKTENIG